MSKQVKARQSAAVVVKKQRKARKAILQSNNSNPLRFDPSSNGLMEKMAIIQSGAASSDGGASHMLGSTGNFYLDSVVDPFREPIRMPDEFVRPTAVHQSFQYFTVTTDDNGEATIYMNPIFGDGATAAVRNRWLGVSQPIVTPPGTGIDTFYDDPDLATLTGGAIPVVAGSRPVSAALLVSYIGDTLSDGGQISAAWIPGDINLTELNTYQAVGTGVQALSLEPGAYTGPLSKGAYCFWRPDDIEDNKFRSNAQALAHSFPLLVVAIKSTVATKVTVRVSAVLNHEITTNGRVLATGVGMVEPDLMLHARKILASYPTSCANDGHINLWQRIQQGCKDFFQTVGESFRNLFAPSLQDISNHSSTIIPLVKAFSGGPGNLTLTL